MSRQGELTDTLGPGILSEALIDIFNLTPIKVTLCYGKSEMVPEEDRKRIISILHDFLIGGHKGANQTYNKIRQRYYWKGIRNDIINYVRTCPVCNERKVDIYKTKTPMIITETPIESFDRVSIDTVGVLKTTCSGNKHLLTVQCHLTKYLLAIPLKDIKAETIAKALATHVIC